MSDLFLGFLLGGVVGGVFGSILSFTLICLLSAGNSFEEKFTSV